MTVHLKIGDLQKIMKKFNLLYTIILNKSFSDNPNYIRNLRLEMLKAYFVSFIAK